MYSDLGGRIKDLIKAKQGQLEDTCRKYGIFLVILHGSYASGKAVERSDIDVGLLGEPAEFKSNYFDIISDFTAIFGDKFDPVILNGAEAMIAYQVAVNGIPLYEKFKGAFNAFKVAAMARYMDTKKFRLLEKEYVKSAVERIS